MSAVMAGVFGAVSDLHAQVNGRAFGIEGTVQVLLPIVNISPTPVVTLPPGGGTQTDTTFNLGNVAPALSGILTSGTVTVLTTSEQSPAATPIPLNSGIYSSARVEDLAIGGIVPLLPPILSADTITASCTNGPTGLVGSTEFTGTTVLGLPLNIPPPPGQVIPIPLLGQLTLNEQVSSTVGNVSSLTVTAIHLELNAIPLLLNAADLTILQAECSVTAPTMMSMIPTSGPTSGGTLVTITGNNFLQLAGVSFGGTPGTAVNVLDDNELTVLSPPHVAGVVNVTVTTAGGTTTSLPFTYIASPAPTLLSLSPTSGPLPGGNVVTITGSNFGNSPAGVTVTFGGTPASVLTVSSGQITVTAPPGAAPGAVNVTVTTPSGTSGPLPYTYVAVPTMTGIVPSSGPVAGGNNVVITGTNFGNSIAGVTVTFGGNQAVVTSVSPTQIAVNAPAAAGPGTVAVLVTTAGGQAGPLAYSYVNGPSITSITPDKGPTTGGTAVTIIGSNFASPATVTFGANFASNVNVVNANTITAVTPPGPLGPVPVVVTSAGGQSAGGFTYVSVPTISLTLGVTPNAGQAGDVITVNGTNFLPGASITICGQTVGTTFVASTQVTFVAPPCALTDPQDVTSTNPDGGFATAADAFTYVDDLDDDPTITSIAPSSGPPTGGTNVTITGNDFQPGATVLFDQSPATNVVVVNANTITAVTPAHAPGAVDVTVTTAGGSFTLPSAFTYQSGLPPECAVTFELDPNDVNGDPDGDGVINLDECNKPTHPKGFFTRYLAEGAANAFFELRLALFNPNTTKSIVLLQFQRLGGGTFTHVLTVNPGQRLTLFPATLPGFTFNAFSTVIESDIEVVVDRQMMWDSVTRYGSHAETSVGVRSTVWYLAEGSTSDPFQLFYLLQNPHEQEVTATIRYLLPFGQAPITREYTLPPLSRTTIPVDSEAPELVMTDVSAVVEASQQIVVERAMYMDRPGESFAAGHESAGVTAPATEWFLAEGATGLFFEMFILLANPNNAPAEVQVDYLQLSGQNLTKNYTVPGNGRFTIWVDDEQFPSGSGNRLLANAAISTRVRSTNAVPIIVERAMWWPQPVWYEAHNSPGTTQTGRKWALAEGETGGANGTETYILIANVSDRPGAANVTLHFEDGTTATKQIAVASLSRTNVQITVDFPQAGNRRFAAIIESVGANPADLVVERAMYSNVAGAVWSAGTNAVATRLQ
jgi:hypothetical protein